MGLLYRFVPLVPVHEKRYSRYKPVQEIMIGVADKNYRLQNIPKLSSLFEVNGDTVLSVRLIVL